jgi:hypothetical protein
MTSCTGPFERTPAPRPERPPQATDQMLAFVQESGSQRSMPSDSSIPRALTGARRHQDLRLLVLTHQVLNLLDGLG